jgi:hypothetical protein
MAMKKIIRNSLKKCNNALVPQKQMEAKTNRESIISTKLKEKANTQLCQCKVKLTEI